MVVARVICFCRAGFRRDFEHSQLWNRVYRSAGLGNGRAQPGPDCFERRLREADFTHQCRSGFGQSLQRTCGFDTQKDSGLEHLAAVGDGGHGDCHLQRRNLEVALADAQVHRAGGGRQAAGPFKRQVNAGAFAESQIVGHLHNCRYSDATAQAPEIDVARFGNSLFHFGCAMTVAAMICAAADSDRAGAIHTHVQPFLSGCERHYRFDHRAARNGILNSAAEIIFQRCTGKNEQFAIAYIHYNHRAFSVCQRQGSAQLGISIQCQVDGPAMLHRYGNDAGTRSAPPFKFLSCCAGYAAEQGVQSYAGVFDAVDLLAEQSGHAAKHAVVLFLNPVDTDAITGVDARVFDCLTCLQWRNLAEEADNEPGHVSIRTFAAQPCFNSYTREPLRRCLYARCSLQRHVCNNGMGNRFLVNLPSAHLACAQFSSDPRVPVQYSSADTPDAAPYPGAGAEQFLLAQAGCLLQGSQPVLGIAESVVPDCQIELRPIRSENYPVTIEYRAARRLDALPRLGRMEHDAGVFQADAQDLQYKYLGTEHEQRCAERQVHQVQPASKHTHTSLTINETMPFPNEQTVKQPRTGRDENAGCKRSSEKHSHGASRRPNAGAK